MVKSNVKAFVRTRPTASSVDGLKVLPDGCSVSIKLPKDAEAGLINNKQENFVFKFDGVLENVSQETLYNTAAAEVVDTVLSGFSGCVFAYGQTGAGKTFTMSGDLRNYAHRGVIPRAVHQLFREVDTRVDKLYEVQVSYLEIYNEQLYDLLAENPGSSSEGLSIMEDAQQGTYVRGLTRVTVRSEEEALAQYFVGEQGRSMAQHVLNASSSRSHCVFTLHLRIRTSDAANERAVVSRLHLVDLAGSERTKKTNASGQTLKEAQFINKSLSFLEQTVTALSRRDPHVPFRQSRLTSVLRDALGGNCKTVMIANIWGEAAHLDETMSTLRFAARVRTLTSDLRLAESSDDAMLLRRYERQIRELKQELSMRDALSGRSRTTYEDLSEADVRDLQALCKRFIQGEVDVDELPQDSLRRIKETYKQLKVVASSAAEEAASQLTALRAEAALAGAQAATAHQGAPGTAGGRVGDVDADSRGFQVGTAPADLRPAKGIQPLGSGTSSPGIAQGGATGGGALAGTLSAQPSSPGLAGEEELGGTVVVPGGAERNAAFARFKHDTPEGRNLNGVVKERAAQLRGAKIAIKESSAAVNAAKAQIDALSSRLATSPGGQQADGVIDAEHHQLTAQLKAAKATYRRELDALKDARSSLEPLAAGVADAKQELIGEFERWLAASGAAAFAGTGAAGEDELDAGEAFERMQMARVTASDPDSLAYHAAMRKSTQQAAVRGSRAFGGEKAAADAIRKREYMQAINAGLVKH